MERKIKHAQLIILLTALIFSSCASIIKRSQDWQKEFIQKNLKIFNLLEKGDYWSALAEFNELLDKGFKSKQHRWETWTLSRIIETGMSQGDPSIIRETATQLATLSEEPLDKNQIALLILAFKINLIEPPTWLSRIYSTLFFHPPFVRSERYTFIVESYFNAETQFLNCWYNMIKQERSGGCTNQLKRLVSKLANLTMLIVKRKIHTSDIPILNCQQKNKKKNIVQLGYCIFKNRLIKTLPQRFQENHYSEWIIKTPSGTTFSLSPYAILKENTFREDYNAQ